MSLAEPALAAVVSETAPAKINLALHVTGRRPDGYHLLDMVVAFTEIGDRLTVERGDADAFAVSGPFASQVPLSADNLVLRARDAFAARLGAASPLAITLEKNLPVASGIGGGSSDAAATLRALSRMFPLKASRAELSALALPLGADVPMCLDMRPARVRGIGEVLEPIGDLPTLQLVLVNPGVPIATPTVFAALQRRENPPLPERLSTDAFLDWLRATRNDLEAPARTLAPPVSEALESLRAEGASFARMSGSGATCFGVFPDTAAARRAAGSLRAARPAWWVEATRTTN